MTLEEIEPIIKSGKTAILPNFEGYFKWDYGNNRIIFQNNRFTCDARQLDIANRNDFYYII